MNTEIRHPDVVAIFNSNPIARRYYWWYKFLQLHSGYRKYCDGAGSKRFASIYKDFGNVHALSFPAWWERYGIRVSAMQVQPFVAEEITSPDQLLRFGRLPDESVLVVAIHTYANRRDIDRQLAAMLNEKQRIKRGPKPPLQLRNYNLEPWPRGDVVEKAYRVLVEARQAKQGTPLHEIGRRAGLRGPRAPQLTRENDPYGSQRSLLALQTRRYIKRGKEIERNAVRGLFPKYSRRKDLLDG
jgi:hypothetical protein